jgi:ribosomal protein S18 acetylase RimI-like enzyme
MLSIDRGSAADLDSLRPLWLAIHHAHAASMPELAPYVSDDESWGARRALYQSILAKPDTILLLAREDGELVGYALTHVLSGEDTWTPDTWRTGERIAELESLGVLPAQRGSGIGSALLDAVDAELEALGVDDVIVGVLPGNVGAVELYRRRGFRPTWLYMSRFAGR